MTPRRGRAHAHPASPPTLPIPGITRRILLPQPCAHAPRCTRATVHCAWPCTQLATPLRFTIYIDGDHDAWTPAYATQELYDWMFAQKRGAPTQGPATIPTSMPAK